MTTDPTGREIPADELAEAERALSETVEDPHLSAALACVEATGASSDIPAYVGIELYNALDERGRERDAARAEVEETRRLIDEAYRQRAHMQQLAIVHLGEVERARDVCRRLWQHLGRPDGVGLDVELIDAVADAVQSGRAARAEVERLGERLHAAQVRVVELELTPDERAELERLRARDEKAKGVVQAWWDRRGVFEQGTELWAALDALARAHEDRADR